MVVGNAGVYRQTRRGERAGGVWRDGKRKRREREGTEGKRVGKRKSERVGGVWRKRKGEGRDR